MLENIKINKSIKTKIIALYLPQYHPIKENDEWYGKGFTEWTNVAKARPLYRGHYQPHIPADLGFYDLRMKEVRQEQAKMAQEYGVDAFAYWTYWFKKDDTLMEMPIWEVYKDKEITLPFCLAWANHSWKKETWNLEEKKDKEVIKEQQYLGEEDYEAFFYHYLPIFKDERYLRTADGKMVFIVFAPLDSEKLTDFISCLSKLAEKENLNNFYFIGKDSDCRDKEKIINAGFDAVYDDNTFNIHHRLSKLQKAKLMIQRNILRQPTKFKYKDAIEYMITQNDSADDVVPVIAPNFDHSPRSGSNTILLEDCNPTYFEKVAKKAIEVEENKKTANKFIVIKSWNEWGEGNHMEPDLKYGRGYLEALKKAKES